MKTFKIEELHNIWTKLENLQTQVFYLTNKERDLSLSLTHKTGTTYEKAFSGYFTMYIHVQPSSQFIPAKMKIYSIICYGIKAKKHLI